MLRNAIRNLFLSTCKTLKEKTYLLERQTVLCSVFGRNTDVRSRGLVTSLGHTQPYTENEIRFKGMYVSIENKEEPLQGFDEIMTELLVKYKTERKRSVFLEIPINQSHLIKVAAKYGFTYHHARNHVAVLSKWLPEESQSKIPEFANHQVGVAGACFNADTDELLVVQDKGRYSKWWKFPGGFSELGEFVGETAVRETFEETGIESEFMSVLALRQQHNVIFGQSDFYFICRLHPKTFDIDICPDEIESCDWMKIDELLQMNDATPFVKLVCRLIRTGNTVGFDNVDIVGSEIESWVTKNKKMFLYHRPEVLT